MIALVGPDLILFFYGPKWTAATPIFAALSLGIFARFSTRTSSSLLRATGNLRGLFISQIIYAAGTIIGCSLAIPFGLIAMSATVSLVLVLSFFIITGFAFRSVDVDIPTFFSAHLAGLKVSVIVAFATGVVLDLCHRNALHGFVPLAAAGLSIALVGIVLTVARSHWILGDVGMKIAMSLDTKLRRFNVKREA